MLHITTENFLFTIKRDCTEVSVTVQFMKSKPYFNYTGPHISSAHSHNLRWIPEGLRQSHYVSSLQ